MNDTKQDGKLLAYVMDYLQEEIITKPQRLINRGYPHSSWTDHEVVNSLFQELITDALDAYAGGAR